MSEPTRIVSRNHLRATQDGEIDLRVSGCGPAVVTLRSARGLGPRWLGGGRPRIVRFGSARLLLTCGRVTTVTLPLSREHLALLHRMQTIRTTIRVQTAAGVCKRRVHLHAPGRHRRLSR
jgi:hypothetical protein